jgi:hypothetical protein
VSERAPLLALAVLVVALALGAVALTSATGVRPVAAGTERMPGATAEGGATGRLPSVELIGDSITDGSRQVLVDALDERYDVVVDAVAGRTFAEMVPAARAAAGRRPDHVIVNLGANDVLLDRPRAETEAAARAMVGAFAPGTCIHVVTVSDGFLSFGDRDRQAPARDLDAWLVGVAAEGGHRVIDWAALLRRHVEAGQPGGPATIDSIHPGEVGQQLLAGAYTRSLETCTPTVTG